MATDSPDVRSALLKTSLSLPVVDGELILGTWQQVVAINLDNREMQAEAGGGYRRLGRVASPPAFLCGFQYLNKYLNSVHLPLVLV